MPKLRVSHDSDFYEHEADRVAEQVVQGSSLSDYDAKIPSINDGNVTGGEESNQSFVELGPSDEKISRKCVSCKEEEDQERIKISRKEGTTSNSFSQFEVSKKASKDISNTLTHSGFPIDTRTRKFMESRFNYDFSKVRVHTDEIAAESAQSVYAAAYTVGNDIVFAHGQYAPQSNNGRKLLAHELAHVIQQAGTRSPSWS